MNNDGLGIKEVEMNKIIVETVIIIVKVIPMGSDDELRITTVEDSNKIKVQLYKHNEFIRANASIRDSIEALINSYLNKYGKKGYVLRATTVMEDMLNSYFYPQYTTFYLQRTKEVRAAKKNKQRSKNGNTH